MEYRMECGTDVNVKGGCYLWWALIGVSVHKSHNRIYVCQALATRVKHSSMKAWNTGRLHALDVSSSRNMQQDNRRLVDCVIEAELLISPCF